MVEITVLGRNTSDYIFSGDVSNWISFFFLWTVKKDSAALTGWRAEDTTKEQYIKH